MKKRNFQNSNEASPQQVQAARSASGSNRPDISNHSFSDRDIECSKENGLGHIVLFFEEDENVGSIVLNDADIIALAESRGLM